ncbi:MAG: peptide deformylase [Bacteroidales bacterium]|nr:peptide deformylase [Bacteroidales bacterium]
MNKVIITLFALAAVACAPKPSENTWTAEEKALIEASDSTMRVLLVTDQKDSIVLRTACDTLTKEMLTSEEYRLLAEKMLATVQSPEQDGVGIAAPQVGISRRVIAVMRYDKEGRPFEVYPNAKITAVRGEKELGPEGCLSIPGRRGDVLRYRDIDITYSTPQGDTTESVQGYSAIIFQHECDHLDGVLYTDYL